MNLSAEHGAAKEGSWRRFHFVWFVEAVSVYRMLFINVSDVYNGGPLALNWFTETRFPPYPVNPMSGPQGGTRYLTCFVVRKSPFNGAHG